MNLVCIMCPVGCNLKVDKNGNDVVVSGNRCPRGAEYGRNEITCPKRMVTTVVKINNGTVCLKTDKAIKKELVDDCLRFTKTLKLPKKIKAGDIVAKNILGEDVNLVATEVNYNI